MTPHWEVENLSLWSLDQYLPQPRFQRFQIHWSRFAIANILKLLALKFIGPDSQLLTSSSF